ncbi:MAG: NAD(P)-dependent glycerol-3-phosphate dehydrogenase [Gammaproteobacteria bacterium]|nr:NAD(P)-dependent glycerol-3-phosphate dehydrogenase [Gammaproteobacteria bacterium]
MSPHSAAEQQIERIAVLGAGSFGTALAVHLARRGHPTLLWGRNAGQLRELEQDRENKEYLPGCKFPKNLAVEPDLGRAVAGADEVLIAVPSHALHELLDAMKPHLRPGQGLICACKGLEPKTGRLVHEVFESVLGGAYRMAVVSGPTFARELGQGLPTAVTVASADTAYAEQVVNALHGGGFRAYSSDDVVGVEVGGSVKNVLAIGVGIADGIGLGANTRAALITRGLAEIMRLGEALGGRRETFMGLAGLGDLVLTCTDNQSRNRRMGLALAQGKTLQQALAEIKQVVEGVRVAPEVLHRAQSLGVDMPITEQVVRVLAGEISPIEAVKNLATRPPRAERH